MMSNKSRLLATGAFSALVLAGGAASAQTTQVYGGGATLPAPLIRQAADCYGAEFPLLNRNGVAQNLAQFYFRSSPTASSSNSNTFNCEPIGVQTAPREAAGRTLYPNDQVQYLASGSGGGIRAWLTGFTNSTFTFANFPSGFTPFPTVHYALSETALNSAFLGVYNNGGIVPGTNNTLSVVAPGGGSGNGSTTFRNPSEVNGAAIQFPALISAVAPSYHPIYRKVRNGDGSVTSFTFNIRTPFSDGTGGLRMNTQVLCEIYTGRITNWNDPKLRALNGNVSLRDPDDILSGETVAQADARFSVPMILGGRADASGTTSVWTRALARQCGDLSAPITEYADSTERLPGGTATPATQTYPAGLVAAFYNKLTNTITAGTETPGRYTLIDGNDGVAQYVGRIKDLEPGPNAGDAITWGRIGYNSTDWVRPFVSNTPNIDNGLHTAAVSRPGSTTFVQATPKNASDAFKGSLPPQSADPDQRRAHRPAGLGRPELEGDPDCVSDCGLPDRWHLELPALHLLLVERSASGGVALCRVVLRPHLARLSQRVSAKQAGDRHQSGSVGQLRLCPDAIGLGVRHPLHLPGARERFTGGGWRIEPVVGGEVRHGSAGHDRSAGQPELRGQAGRVSAQRFIAKSYCVNRRPRITPGPFAFSSPFQQISTHARLDSRL
jgi:phosphate transport system substrate-binding protein